MGTNLANRIDPLEVSAMTTVNAPPSLLATRQGKLILVLLCSVAFLDFVDVTIVNVALPSVRRGLGMSVQNLQWIPSAYLLTYGGFMLLGGRAADLLGRRRVLVVGTSLFGVASIFGGLAGSSGVLIAARLAQGAGAALMLPAALSILTTTFNSSGDRHKALGAWGGVAGLASAVGVLLGGVLTQGPGWRWVFFVNPPVCLLVLLGTFWLVSAERHHAPLVNFDLRGAVLSTGGMLLLVYAIVTAPDVGWGTSRTLAELFGAVALLVVFVVNEQRRPNPLLPLSIFRIKGLAAADVTQVIAMAGFISMFFFLTLYMQNVLHYSPIRTGLAYLPVTARVGVASGITAKVLARIGTRTVIVAASLIAASGVLYLSRMPVHGSYVTDLLPGLVIMSIGLGALMVAVTTAANAGVPGEKAGLAAALINASQQLGGALGLAIFAAIATSRTTNLVAEHVAPPAALTSGFQRALLASSLSLVAAAVIATRASNTRGELADDLTDQSPELLRV
jgi:EmrB/QacA subfamily drug resistance transporter